jgi:hypothetical protein
MSRRTEPVTIDGVVYRVAQLPTRQGVPLAHKLLKAVGPVVIKFIEGLPEKGEVSETKLALVVVDALQELPTDLLQELAERFLENCTYQEPASGALELPLKMNYDDHFAGEYKRWMQWFIACARFNFQGFFPNSVGSSGTDPSGRAAASASAKTASS